MSASGLHQFLYGTLTMAGFVAALIFARFWRMTTDRLFLYFALAFLMFAVNWMALAVTDPASENRYYIFLLRLVAFGFIIFGIVDKNRQK